MKSDIKKDIYMISIIVLIMSVGLFLYGLATHKANLIALPCGILAATSIIWMIVFNPSNKVDSLKPTKRSKRLLRAFIIMLIAVSASVVLEYPSVIGDKKYLAQWVIFIIIRLCYIGLAVYFFMEYKKSKATEDAQDNNPQARQE